MSVVRPMFLLCLRSLYFGDPPFSDTPIWYHDESPIQITVVSVFDREMARCDGLSRVTATKWRWNSLRAAPQPRQKRPSRQTLTGNFVAK